MSLHFIIDWGISSYSCTCPKVQLQAHQGRVDRNFWCHQKNLMTYWSTKKSSENYGNDYGTPWEFNKVQGKTVIGPVMIQIILNLHSVCLNNSKNFSTNEKVNANWYLQWYKEKQML